MEDKDKTKEQLINELKKLRQQIDELEVFININPDIFYVLNLEMKLIKWNKGVENLTGLSPEELIYRPAIEFIVEEDRETVLREMNRVFETGFSTVEARFFSKDGTLVPYICNGTVLKNEKGEAIGFTGTGRDITEHKQLEEQREIIIQDLQKALLEIKTLRGIVPICSSCKKIRDDTGYWNQVEVYIQDHSDAEFSHGICPDCAKKIYGDLLKD